MVRKSILRKYSVLASQVGLRIFTMNNVVSLSEGSDLTSQIASAAKALQKGKVIAVPTDTLYGIAALAQSDNAVENIYEIKKRNIAKPLAICVSEVKDVYKWGTVTVPHSLLTSLLPGPVTLVFNRTPLLNPSLNPGHDTVAIRIPDAEFIRGVAAKCSSPLALTSANISTKESPLEVKEFCDIWDKLEKVYDGGRLGEEAKCREGSTIVELLQEGLYKIIRQGSAYDQTVKLLHKYDLAPSD
ncbi:unnamed protein product [Meganyctiphanes norvegica]|uniref:Threonylcarbamoyl-AMP synthase n=1 Tax=Meganyctiphanes norvegica TaxID=48144 RepID=A0AAV2PQ74_MEGNR